MPYQRSQRSYSGSKRFGSRRNVRPTGGRKYKKESIHPSKFIQAARSAEAIEYQSQYAFSDFPLATTLQKNIEKKGFTVPSPIQDQAIMPALEGRDVIGIANTGTGKTLAFALPVLHRLLTDRQAHALIVAPTRELAQQILDECKLFFQGEKIHHALLIGGTPMRGQFKDLSYRPRLVIGTPGRIKDHIERETLRLKFFSMIVLDEVDRMLDMGFVHDMRTIMKCLNDVRQSFFFSATMDPKIRVLIDEFSNDPIFISVKTGNTTDQVEQNVIHFQSSEQKIEKLSAILEANKEGKFLIFNETKHGSDKLGKELCQRGFLAEAMHGNKSQSQRQRILDKFKSGRTRILVATDVAARGIDVADITHVINYSTPNSYSDYVHRIGRAGRAGKKGYALTFLEGRQR